MYVCMTFWNDRHCSKPFAWETNMINSWKDKNQIGLNKN